jgi:hypothetical protein
MFAELTEELLDLTVSEKGFRDAAYASNDGDPCSSSSLACSVILCCSIHICW